MWPAGVLFLVAGFVVAECLPTFNDKGAAPQDGVGNTRALSGVSVQAYAVTLTIDASDSFDATTVLSVAATDATDTLTINAHKNLKVDKVTVYGPDRNGVNVQIAVDGKTVNEDLDEVEIKLRTPLRAGQLYNVTVTATGQYGNPSDPGLIRVPFRDNGKVSWLAAIRSSAASARRVFPCIDGPAQVADVTLTVSRPTSHTAVANTPVASSETFAGLTKDTFAAARLAPHQVGLVLAPLQQASGSQDARVSVWVRGQGAEDLAAVLKYVSALSDAVGDLSGVCLAANGLSVVAVPGVQTTPTANLATLDEDDVLGMRSPSSAHRDALLELAEAVGQPAVRAAARPEHWGDAWVSRSLAAHLRHRYADNATNSEWRLAEQQGVLQLQDVLEAGARMTDAALPV